MKFAGLIACILLLVFGLHCTFGSKGDANFKVRINEKGTRFIEKIKINVQENTVRFTVPKHNDVDKSEVLLEFNLNLTITRLPDKGSCFIKPLDEGLRSPRKLKSDLTYVQHVQRRIKKPGSFLSSTEWGIDGQIESNDLPSAVVKFCAGFPVYRLKEISEDSVEIEPQEGSSNDSTGTRKREIQKRNDYPMCRNGLPNLPCPANEWKLYCKLVGRTCVYWSKCNIDDLIKKHSRLKVDPCEFAHNYNSLICCEFRCPTK